MRLSVPLELTEESDHVGQLIGGRVGREAYAEPVVSELLVFPLACWLKFEMICPSTRAAAERRRRRAN